MPDDRAQHEADARARQARGLGAEAYAAAKARRAEYLMRQTGGR